jgi:hypothetical protein
MKSLSGARFQNAARYFQRGISFSNTGIYSPTFRLGHGGVFDQTGSNIFCDVLRKRLLLGILCSTLLRFFEKAFINHGVHAQLEELPIVLPTEEETQKIIDLVDEIISKQKADVHFDYRELLSRLDSVVNEMYQLDDAEKAELGTWFRRHYPKLTGDGTEEA